MRPHADFSTSVKKYQYLFALSHQSLAAAGRWLWCEGGNVIDNLLPLHLELRVFLGFRILEGRQEAQEFVLRATNNWREERRGTTGSSVPGCAARCLPPPLFCWGWRRRS